jgi:hypothetical protein
MPEARLDLRIGGTIKFVTETETPVTCRTTLIYDGFSITVEGDHMAYTLPVDHKVTVKVSYVDAADNPAEVQSIRWDTSDKAIIDVNVSTSDDNQATVFPQGKLGQVQVRATADVDLGEGIKPLITTMDVEVVGGEAVAGTIEPVGPAEPV